jgi:integrase
MRLSPKAKRLFMNCDCPIWLYGTTETSMLPRQSTGTRELAVAEALKRTLIADGKDEEIHGPTLSSCIDRYLESRTDELGEKTAAQYRLVLGRLRDYCRDRGIANTSELTVDVLEDFKTDGLVVQASGSKSTAVAKLRCFLRAAYRRGWINEPLVEKVTTHHAVFEQKTPYTDEEVTAFLSEAERLSHGTHGYAKHPKTFRLLLELMLETGMRVGDAVRFDPKRLEKGNHLWIYTYFPMKKRRAQQPKAIESFISDKLKNTIDQCQWLSKQLPFSYGAVSNPSRLANEVYERMQTIGARCGVKDCRPHRLRHTFAVRALTRGMQLDDVSRLLEHSSVRTTERHYGAWVSTRKLRLKRLVA